MEFKKEQPNVLVFETNIRYKRDISKVALLIDTEARILKWNVDLEDVDKILRIEALDLHPNEIITLVANAGFHCYELTD